MSEVGDGSPGTADLDREIDAVLRAASDGSGASLVLEGPADRAAVVDRLVVAAVRRGCDVRLVSGSISGAVPFSAVSHLLRQPPGRPITAPSPGAGLDLPSLRALAERFDAAAVGAPLVVVVDDADLIDAASARVLAYLAGNLDARRVAVVLACSPLVDGSWLQELVTVHGAARVTTSNLSGDSSVALDAHAPPAVPAGPGRAVVEALAVLGGSATVAGVAAVAELPVDSVLEVLDELFATGLLRAAPAGVGELVPNASLLGSLTPGRASDLHLRAARHLRRVSAPVEAVADHVRRAAPGALPWGLEVLRAAATRAFDLGDAAGAVAWLHRAAEEPGAAESVQLLIELATAQARAGDPGAAGTLRRAVERSNGEQRVRLRIQLARQLVLAGHAEEAVTVLDESDADLDPAAPWYERAHLEVRTATAAACRSALSFRHRSAEILGELTAAVHDRGVDDPSVLAELAYEHALAGTSRDVVVGFGERAIASAGPIGDVHAHGLFLALVWAEAFDPALALLQMMHPEARTRPLEAHRRGTFALAQGDLDRAVAWSRVAVADMGWVAPVLVPGARAQLARALIRQGDLDGAAAALELPGGVSRWRRHATYHPVLLANAELAAARGEWRRAASFADDCATFSDAMGTVNPAVIPWHVVAARARAELGDRSGAEELLDAALGRAVTFGAPGPIGALRRGLEGIGAPAPEALLASPSATPSPDDGSVRLRLLGDTVVNLDGADRRLGDDLVDRAVCILAVADRGVHDEELAEALWPEGDPEVGRTRLRNVLMRVRQRYGPLVERRGRTVSLVDQVEVDLHRFRAAADIALSAGDPDRAAEAGTQALELYRGDLCPAHPFEAWAAAPRSAAQLRRLAVLDRLSELAAARGDIAGSLAYFEDAVAAEPWNEDRYLDAADHLLRAGRPAAARSILRRSAAMCRELGVPPSPRHRDLGSAVG